MKKIFYLDNNNKIVDEEKATHFYVHEYNLNGDLINYNHFLIQKNGENNFKDMTLTSQDMELLKNIKNANGEYPFQKS